MDFLLMLSKLFSLGVTVSRYERIDIENGRFRSNAVTLSKISGRRGRPQPIIFAQLVRPMNALQLCR